MPRRDRNRLLQIGAVSRDAALATRDVGLSAIVMLLHQRDAWTNPQIIVNINIVWNAALQQLIDKEPLEIQKMVKLDMTDFEAA